ncbi:MAG: hypothetical protein AAGA17_00055 [Actinomycetota bacterium]
MRVLLVVVAAAAVYLHTVGLVPDTVAVANGTHQVPDDVADAVHRHVPLLHQGWTLRMMACESAFDPDARNGSHVGLAQHAERYLADRVARHGDGATLAEFYTDVDVQVLVTEGLRSELGRAPWSESEWCWA